MTLNVVALVFIYKFVIAIVMRDIK